MKLEYFDIGVPDENDQLLQEAIKENYVNKDCLLGGLMIMTYIGIGKNPCKTICPNKKCKRNKNKEGEK